MVASVSSTRFKQLAGTSSPHPQQSKRFFKTKHFTPLLNMNSRLLSLLQFTVKNSKMSLDVMLQTGYLSLVEICKVEMKVSLLL